MGAMAVTESGPDREALLQMLDRLSPVLVRIDALVRKVGFEPVMALLDKAERALTNPAARFRRKG